MNIVFIMCTIPKDLSCWSAFQATGKEKFMYKNLVVWLEFIFAISQRYVRNLASCSKIK